MISRNNDWIYVHIQKTGGSAIQTVLKKYSDDEIRYVEPNRPEVFRVDQRYNMSKHAYLQAYADNLGINNLTEMAVIASIRNPYDRIMSLHMWIDGRLTGDAIKNTILSYKGGTQTEMLSLYGILYEYIHYIRFENIQEDFDRVCTILEIPKEKLPVVNRIHPIRDYRKLLNRQNKLLIQNKFRDDFHNFGYEMEIEMEPIRALKYQR